ncbi:pentatricopeptide repeat-containing protein 5, mitochondrial [Ceratobasidium sp. AG-Ba]|nr:pentatricopeptide repeat-containing protein 5, mitochondrial [Ceratobasidium sp. AG-Ba]
MQGEALGDQPVTCWYPRLSFRILAEAMACTTHGRIALARRPPTLCRAFASTSLRRLALADDIAGPRNNNRIGTRSPLYDSKSLRLPQQTPSIAYFNKGLELRSQNGNVVGAIHFWNKEITSGTRPNADSYTQLMQIFADHRLYEQCVRAFEDMLSMKVGDKLTALNLVMLSASENLSHITKTYELFSAHSVQPDTTTYQHHLSYLDKTDNLERAIQLITKMDDKQIPVNKDCMRTVILMACRLNMPKLAMDLCANAGNVLGRLDDEVYMNVLISAASTMNWPVTTWAYDALNAVGPLISLTEPLCVNILNLASRQGHPTLAQSILDCLVRERIPIQEYHLAPLIGSYCNSPRKDGLREAFLVLDKFKEYNVELLPENQSASALVGILGKSTEKLDEAYNILLELPRPVNVEAVNAVLQAAAVTLSDLPRAIGVYKELANLECEPTTQTYDILLAGCLKAQHKALGDKLFAEMVSKNLKPSAQTYTRLILLALTQDVYESAFEKLEQMKENKMTPPLTVYEALVRRLVKENDPRADLALEDMETCGYRVRPQLRKFLLGEEKEGEGRRDLLEGAEAGKSGKRRYTPGARNRGNDAGSTA